MVSLGIMFSMTATSEAQPCKQYKKNCNGQSECTCNSNAECCQGKCENHECQRIWYNFPSYSKVKIERNPNGQSWLYLEFKWEKCPPNFEQGKAVEFEINIRPKCFLQPVGGMDTRTDCDEVMGKYQYSLPNAFIPGEGKNCYVDLWNYKLPSADQVVPLTESACGSMDSQGEQCAINAVNFGAFNDQSGNFAVGLHDASVLQAGILYSIRYPVEINDSAECQDFGKYKQSVNGENLQCVQDGDPIHNDWGRAWVTMQTFKNSCDLPCDVGETAYTCPEIIGAVVDKWGFKYGCKNADKYTDFWLNRLCVPTTDWEFTPGIAITDPNAVCMTEQNSSDLDTLGVCCVDNDGDGYYAKQSVDTYGWQSNDCNDENDQIHPFADEIVGDVIDSDCDGNGDSTSAALFGDILVAGHTTPCPVNSECHPGDHIQGLCPDGVHFEEKICNSCMWEVISECPGGPCTPNQTAGCGNCGTQTCNANSQWGACLNQGSCSPGQMQQQTCNGNGTQSQTCQNNCSWGSWSACSVNPVCSPGQTQQQSCTAPGNLPGTQTHTCDANGQWGGWGACIQSCTDVYLASASPACYTTPGGPTLCLSVSQVNGSTWKYQVCKQGGTFSNNYKTVLHDDNYLPQLGDTYVGNSGDTCSPWRNFSVSYISGYGPSNGAGVRADVLSPSNCGQANCTYSTGTVTVRKECE